MAAYFWIGLGSAVGGIGRYWVSTFVAMRFGDAFPWGTLVVNVAGSFLIGLLAAGSAAESRILLTPGTRQFLMIGVMGGFTTFSSFSLQTFSLIQEREWLHASGNIALSIVLCLASVWLGYGLGAKWFLS